MLASPEKYEEHRCRAGKGDTAEKRARAGESWIGSWLEQSGLYFRVQAASPWHTCTYIPLDSKKENNENFNYVLSLRGVTVT